MADRHSGFVPANILIAVRLAAMQSATWAQAILVKGQR